jgi:hypothetical protein
MRTLTAINLALREIPATPYTDAELHCIRSLNLAMQYHEDARERLRAPKLRPELNRMHARHELRCARGLIQSVRGTLHLTRWSRNA